jgi:hypothetical protein
MTTYYVRKTGNDSNGGTDPDTDAKLTIESGISLLDLGGGDILDVGAGTYAEGSSYLNLTQDYTTQTTIRRDPNASLGDVVWTGSGSGAYSLLLNGTTNLTIDGIRLTTHKTGQSAVVDTRSGTSGCVIKNGRIDDDANAMSGNDLVRAEVAGGHIEIENTTIHSDNASVNGIGQAAGANVLLNDVDIDVQAYCLLSVSTTGNFEAHGGSMTSASLDAVRQGTAASNAVSVIVDGVTISAPNGVGVFVQGGTSGNLATVTITDNTIVDCVSGIEVDDFVTSCTVTGNDVQDASGSYGIRVGTDSSAGSGTIASPDIDNNSVIGTGSTTHCYLIGQNARDAVYGSGNRFDARLAAYGLIDKSDDADITFGGINYGGTNSAFYSKGGNGATVTSTPGARVYMTAGGAAMQLLQQDIPTPTPSNNLSITGIDWVVTNGQLFNVGTTGDGDIGTSIVVDSNRYYVGLDATWGDLLGSEISSLSEARTAWDSYNETGNDDASSELALASPSRDYVRPGLGLGVL